MHRELRQDQLYVTADLMILTVREGRLKLLLSRRVNPPCEGRWALPGLFVGLTESAEAAAQRLLQEMLPVRGAFLEQLYTFTDVGRDPRGRVLSVAYLVIVPWGRLREPLAESSFRCFEADLDGPALRLADGEGLTLAAEELAFDHGQIIRTGIQRLRGKIDYTDIGFRFLEDPQAFSLGELQTVFEAVLDEAADSSNFRRTILNRYARDGRLEQTDQAKRARGRPAALYRIKL